MLVTDDDSPGVRRHIAVATCPDERRLPRSLRGLFFVDLETGRRYPVFIVLVRH